MKRAFFVAVLVAVLLRAIAPVETQQPDALKFFKNYFGTFGHVLGGVGLKGQGIDGFATGLIHLSGAPESGGHPTVDVMAALLYWQVVTKDSNGPDWGAVGVKFNGKPLSSADGVSGRVQGTGTPPCWSSGGGTGSGGGAWKTYTYRTDVLRYLEIDEETGKYRLNGGYSVTLPDGGDRIAIGAGLFVLYRDTSKPFSAYVLYDGGVTINNSNPTWSVNMVGFYQPAPSPNAEVFTFVGSGQANKRESFSFTYPSATIPTTYLDHFSASNGSAWDSKSFTVSLGNTPATVSQVTTTFDTAGLSGADCLTPALVGFRTAVLDTDGDGLLDAWESPTPPMDPYGVQLPNLFDMGARFDHKDVFIEVGYMYADGNPSTEELDGTVSYGGVPKPAHSHVPTPAAIKLMGDSFRNAPVVNPDSTTGIRLHVDAGPGYDAGVASAYVISGSLARGGEALDESITTPACERDPATDPVWKCLFHDYPGTVGWKTGFRYIRDELISWAGDPPDPDSDDPCDVPGYEEDGVCKRRFDRNRHDIFHYAFFAHAVGLPKSLQACLDVSDPEHPVEKPDSNGYCPAPLIENPAFFVPRTNSGIGDFPGGDILVTLGAFSDRYGWPGGTDFMVASTLTHEFGHNIELRHGAWQDPSGAVVPGPNCVPTYLSVMNYLYQLRGLLDNSGRPHLDFSSAIGPALDEQRLFDVDADGAPPWPASFIPTYRIGWYAPLVEGTYLWEHRDILTVAGRHCDGSPLSATELVPMVRIDAATAAGDIDWNANGTLDGPHEQDVNFNGRTLLAGSPELPASLNDWENIHLNQIGARRNVGAPLIDELGRRAFGPLSADLARTDWARTDWARTDWARTDWARTDWAQADWGDQGHGDIGRYALARTDWASDAWARTDWARTDWARTDWGGDDGRGDYGGGDLFLRDPNNPGGCLDHETATFLANTPPYEFTCAVEAAGVRCDWKATNEGGERRYNVYRVQGTELGPGQEWVRVGNVTAVSGKVEYFFVDEDLLVKGQDYLYFATAVYLREGEGPGVEMESDPSNTDVVKGPNHPPVGNALSVTVTEDTATAITLTASDIDGDALTYSVASGPAHGSLSGTPPALTYTPALNYNGPDSFAFTVADGTATSAPATVSITVTAVNDAPVAHAQSVTTAEDTAKVIMLSATDVDGNALTYTVLSGPAHGSLSGTPPALTYTPALDYNGPDSFTFRVSDATATSALATVSITVAAANDAPVAVNDSYVLTLPSLIVPAPGVLGNDRDVDGNSLTAVVVSEPSKGALVLNANGSFTYTPGSTIGADSFTYRASDGSLTSNVATVRITAYALVGVQNVPPATVSKVKAGATQPMKWQFKDGSLVVNSSGVHHAVAIKGGSIYREYRDTDPGSSSYRYDATTNTWYFNLQTKDASGVPYPTGTYEVTITPTTPGYLSVAFSVTLTK